ncbi:MULTISPECIES: phosphocholine cytidylyltransferase family protein [unclassified Bradyrhizobium]|uniref:phosphocholine cytidylyltransferase family protein n=1 Tax=unclassified Bradyrhizobium TaxID=2631580 RepID=UPI0028F13AA4|nr:MULTISPECIES: phosphocholine cytidylyltransferase family protein [unclassified Bradyrhizobium]
MHAIILAAGRGSRLHGLTSDRPKCLIELHGEPLLAKVMRSLQDAGCASFTIVAGYHEHLVRAFVASNGYRAQVVVNAAWATTNMVQSLLAAGKVLQRQRCIVSYSDIFYSSEIVADLARSKGPIAISYDPDGRQLWSDRFAEPLNDIETFRLNRDGTLAEIGEAVADLADVQGQYMGLLRFDPNGFADFFNCLQRIPKRRQLTASMTEVLSLLVKAGKRVTCVPNAWPWGELDTPADVVYFERRYRRTPGSP